MYLYLYVFYILGLGCFQRKYNIKLIEFYINYYYNYCKSYFYIKYYHN